MANILKDSYSVAYADLCFLKRNFIATFISSLVAPILYLVAFGYGMRVGTTEGGVDYIAYVIPGIIAISSMTAGFATTSQKILIQRLFHSSFDEMILSPVNISSIVIGKSIIGMIRGLMGTSIMLILGFFLTPDIFITPMLLILMIFSCFTFSLLGVMAGLVAKSSQTLNMISNLVILPMTFMCGTLFSIDALPELVSKVIWVLPLTHASEMIRSAALGWGTAWISIAVMLIYMAAFFLIDYYIIRKGKY